MKKIINFFISKSSEIRSTWAEQKKILLKDVFELAFVSPDWKAYIY